MQKLKTIFLTKLALLLLLSLQSFESQAQTKSLLTADSLFSTKNYQEALLIYEDIFQNEQAYSPAMLLKMAFISEGMGDFSQTILYLSKYYEYNPNPQIPNKIGGLTNQPSLTGYTMTDREQFVSILTDNGRMITSTLAILLVMSLIMLVLKGFQRGYYITSVILIGLVALSNNLLQKPETGIVTGSTSLVLDHPSAGGNLIQRVGPGHRVVIKSSVDIWYKVEWGGKIAYIKKDQITTI